MAIEIVASRSPEHFRWGFFSWLDVPPMLAGAGVGAFAWFNDPDEAAEFIVDVLASDGPEGPTPEAAERAAAILASDGLTRDGLAALTELAPQSIAFDWAGDIDELLAGSGPFVEQKRAHFRDDDSASGPINEDEYAAFLGWLPEAGL